MTMERICDIYDTAFAEKQIKFTLNVTASITFIINDESRISQVLINLLNNAIKFTGFNGSIEVALEDSDNMMRISVYNNGAAIPIKRLNHI